MLKLSRQVYAQGAQIYIGLIPHNYFVSDPKLFNKKSYLLIFICFDNVSVVNKKVCPRGTKDHLVYLLIFFVFHLKNVGKNFMFV